MQPLTAQRTNGVAEGHVDLEILNDFIDGLLSAAHLSLVAAHVESCAICRETVAKLRNLIELARAEGQELLRAPDALWPLVAAVTIHRRPLRRYLLKELRRQFLLAGFLLIAASASISAWLVLGCEAAGTHPQPHECNGAWHQVVRRGIQQRVKELRDYGKGSLNAERKQLQHSLSR